MIWNTGHADKVLAHQVSWSGGARFPWTASGSDGSLKPERVRFHAEVDGNWRLMLDVLSDDIATIRNLTQVGDTP